MTQIEGSLLKLKARSLPLLPSLEQSRRSVRSRHAPHRLARLGPSLALPLPAVLSPQLQAFSQRSARKLEQKYGTIDRWKQRYQLAAPRDRPAVGVPFGEELPRAEPAFQTPAVAGVSQREGPWEQTRLLPVVAKQPVRPSLEGQREEARRLQAELLARLQRNRRVCQAWEQVNYFQAETRLLELSGRQQQLQGLLRQQGRGTKQAVRIEPTIHEFRRRLLQGASEQSPGGWEVCPPDPFALD